MDRTSINTSYRQQLVRTLAVLDAVAHSENDVELNLPLFYGIEAAFSEIEEFTSEAGIDPDTRIWGATATLKIFCRSIRLLLDQGLEPGELRSKIDPSDEFRFLCELCADAFRRTLDDDGQPLKEAA